MIALKIDGPNNQFPFSLTGQRCPKASANLFNLMM
jgi:hypothetical protein